MPCESHNTGTLVMSVTRHHNVRDINVRNSRHSREKMQVARKVNFPDSTSKSRNRAQQCSTSKVSRKPMFLFFFFSLKMAHNVCRCNKWCLRYIINARKLTSRGPQNEEETEYKWSVQNRAETEQQEKCCTIWCHDKETKGWHSEWQVDSLSALHACVHTYFSQMRKKK